MDTKESEKGEKTYMHVVMWWAAAGAAPPQLQFSLHTFWPSQQHFAEGRREAGKDGKSGNANSNPPDSLKFDLKSRNSWDGRQSRERERDGWQTAFHGLSGWDTLFPGHIVSH